MPAAPAQLSLAVVTPSYNQGRFIERTIRSVLDQDVEGLDYIVTDGGSSDETVEILKRYEDRLRWVSEPDRGQTDAVNKGLAATDSDIIGWLNSDDIYYPGALNTIRELFSTHPEVDVIYGKAHHIDPDDRVMNECDTGDWDFERLKGYCYIHQPALFFRRSVVERFGPLDVSLDYIMDYEYWLRLGAGGAVFHHHHEFLAATRLYPETKTLSARVAIHEEIADVQRRMFGQVAEQWVQGYALSHAERMGVADGRHPYKFRLAMIGYGGWASLRWNRRLPRFVMQKGVNSLRRRLRRAAPAPRRAATQPRPAPVPTPIQPRVSVVVPSYNQGRFLRETLDSLLNQNYPALDVLVMDGGSTDDSVEILKTYGDRIQWVSEPDGGQSDAIRKGFARASGEWITWLNSDDYQTGDALHRLAECVTNNSSIEIAVGRAHYVDEAGNYLNDYPTLPVAGPGVDPAREFFEKGYVAQPSIFYRKEAYERVGGINPDLNFVMDYDLWTRFALAGCQFGVIDADISANRLHGSAKSVAQLLDLYAELVATQKRHFGMVSAYVVQAVSDHLFSILHGRHEPHGKPLRWRMLYFKAMWVCFNARRPWHCLKGLMTTHVCRSSPILNERITNRLLIREAGKQAKARITRRLPKIAGRGRAAA